MIVVTIYCTYSAKPLVKAFTCFVSVNSRKSYTIAIARILFFYSGKNRGLQRLKNLTKSTQHTMNVGVKASGCVSTLIPASLSYLTH